MREQLNSGEDLALVAQELFADLVDGVEHRRMVPAAEGTTERRQR